MLIIHSEDLLALIAENHTPVVNGKDKVARDALEGVPCALIHQDYKEDAQAYASKERGNNST